MRDGMGSKTDGECPGCHTLVTAYEAKKNEGICNVCKCYGWNKDNPRPQNAGV